MGDHDPYILPSHQLSTDDLLRTIRYIEPPFDSAEEQPEYGATSWGQDRLEGQPPRWPDHGCPTLLSILRNRSWSCHVVFSVLPREEGRPRAARIEAPLGPLSSEHPTKERHTP